MTQFGGLQGGQIEAQIQVLQEELAGQVEGSPVAIALAQQIAVLQNEVAEQPIVNPLFPHFFPGHFPGGGGGGGHVHGGGQA